MKRPWQHIAAEIDLPPATAIWVLGAHLLTIAAPVIPILLIYHNIEAMNALLYKPALLIDALLILIIASVCESAQNTADRWYLTEDKPALLDLLFHSMVVLFMCLTSIACRGDLWWVATLAIVLAAYFPIAYLMGWPREPGQAGSGLLMTGVLFERFGDPVVFLQLLSVFLTLYFFHLLLKTRAQSLHGFTTGVNAVGLMAIAVAVGNHANDTDMSWTTFAAITTGTLIICAAAYPKLAALSATPRPSGAFDERT